MKKLFAVILLIGVAFAVGGRTPKTTKLCHGTCTKAGCGTPKHGQTRVCAPCNDIFCNF